MSVTGNVIAGTLSSKGKKHSLKLECKYGKLPAIVFEADAQNAYSVATRMVQKEIVPGSIYQGMIGNKAVFTAPKGWKGGTNA